MVDVHGQTITAVPMRTKRGSQGLSVVGGIKFTMPWPASASEVGQLIQKGLDPEIRHGAGETD